MPDRVLERIMFRPPAEVVAAPIPWPAGMAPQGAAYDGPSDGPLSTADVLVVTWTSAEGKALADVLTPGLASTSWQPYAHGWDAYESQLTDRSPAR